MWVRRADYEALLKAHAEAVGRRAGLEQQIANLNARVEQLRSDWKYERERADRAVDALLMAPGPHAPVMPAAEDAAGEQIDPFREDPAKVAEIVSRMGLDPDKVGA